MKIFWFLFGLIGYLHAQTPDSLLLIYQKKDISSFSVDPLEQIFTIGLQGQLTKYSPSGQLLYQYHNTRLGRISSIDTRDPFNILLFFKDQQTILLLDHTLSVQATLDLRLTAIQSATAVVRSSDNNIWVYDEWTGQLSLLDAHSRITRQSNDLRMSDRIIDGATQLLIRQKELLAIFPGKGVAVFSNWGQLHEWWNIPEIDDYFIRNGLFIYRKSSSYYTYFPQQEMSRPLLLPSAPAKLLKYRQYAQRHYFLDHSNQLHIYQELVTH